MDLFPPSFGFVCILVAIDYVLKRVEALVTRTNDHKITVKFVTEYIFYQYGTPQALIVMEILTFVIGLLRLCLENIL